MKIYHFVISAIVILVAGALLAAQIPTGHTQTNKVDRERIDALETQVAELDDRVFVLEGYHNVQPTPTATATATATDVPPTATATATEIPPTATATEIPPTATATEAPVSAGEPCPDWVHDQYVTTGPDGQQYATWHPMVDPVYGCYFGHNHGNDPASVAPGYMPPFNYASSRVGMFESNHGFKVFAVHDVLTGLDWVVTMHQGTSGRNALCAKWHNVGVAVFDNGVKQAETYFLGDFGASRFADTTTWLTPPDCPNQSDGASQGLRRIPRTGDGYTPYIINDTLETLGLRVRISFLTSDGIDACPDATCAELDRNADNTGSRHRFQVLSDDLTYNIDTPAVNTGQFCTDAYGGGVVDCSDPAAVEQYVASGFSASQESCRAERDSQDRNGCWFFNGEDGSMEAATERTFNGAEPLLPIEWFGGNN